ncbi:MAG: 5'-methylthioadenosine/S-adenosylhomocysteine nucleosidase [Chloroflexi bacterium]|nr:5'-methylthioadenosine/S-adenosylhomocysteine nucleosidase [Chloroflexota bacterium]
MAAGDRPIAVICAIEEEIRHLREALPPAEEVWRGNRRVWLADLDGLPLVISVCGMGMLSAAAVTEAVLWQYEPSAVLNYGCAGSHRTEILPGDIVVGERVVAYDNVREQPDGAPRYAGMRYLRRGETVRAASLAADSALLERATRVMAALEGQHEPWPVALGWPDEIPHRTPRALPGTVASADRWNRTAGSIGALVAQHETHCEDMEAGAIALTCASHDVPFLSIKDISNNELHPKTESDSSFLTALGPELGKRAGALTLAVLRDVAARHG